MHHSSSRFGATSWFRLVTPVTLPPGRLRPQLLQAQPGRPLSAKTIGILAGRRLRRPLPKRWPPAATSTGHVDREPTLPQAPAADRCALPPTDIRSLTFWPST